jgi:hypothetical protein
MKSHKNASTTFEGRKLLIKRPALALALTMAGGYGVQINTFRAALDYWQRWQALPALAK